MNNKLFEEKVCDYKGRLFATLDRFDWASVHTLALELLDCWKTGRQVFICGNGGSGANAMHIANDLIYGISKTVGSGLRCHALTANSSVVTCLANDEGYESIFSTQISVLASPGDVLLVLSGSGNSPNILSAIEAARAKEVKCYGILGYSGGKAKEMLDVPIHFPIDDMQMSEDIQLMVAHIISQWLYEQRKNIHSTRDRL